MKNYVFGYARVQHRISKFRPSAKGKTQQAFQQLHDKKYGFLRRSPIFMSEKKVLFTSNIKFPLGQTVATRGVLDLLNHNEILKLLTRHSAGDWGDLCCEDKNLNNFALSSGEGRLFSAYNTLKGKVWIITEHDRSATTILLPNEY